MLTGIGIYALLFPDPRDANNGWELIAAGFGFLALGEIIRYLCIRYREYDLDIQIWPFRVTWTGPTNTNANTN